MKEKNIIAVLITAIVVSITTLSAYLLGRNHGWSESAKYFTDSDECRVRRRDTL